MSNELDRIPDPNIASGAKTLMLYGFCMKLTCATGPKDGVGVTDGAGALCCCCNAAGVSGCGATGGFQF